MKTAQNLNPLNSPWGACRQPVPLCKESSCPLFAKRSSLDFKPTWFNMLASSPTKCNPTTVSLLKFNLFGAPGLKCHVMCEHVLR